MDVLTNELHLHSYVLLFFCLNICNILLGMNKIPGLVQGWWGANIGFIFCQTQTFIYHI